MESNESLAYIAGFIDGEGCICLSSGKLSRIASLSVIVTNTNEDVINYVNACLPGTVYARDRARRKTIHSVYWYGQDAVLVLELILPYLIVKREVAEVAIEFYFRCIQSRGGSRTALSDAEVILRQSYRDKIQKLNGRALGS